MKKLYCFFTIFVLSFISASNSFAMINLKEIQFLKGNETEFVFDEDINQNQISTEFFKDIIQFSLADVSIYPPKIIPVSDSLITKIFTYQYTPKTVRCRFTVKGKAEDFKNKFALQASGHSLKIKFDSPAENLSTSDEDVNEEEIIKKILKAEEQNPAQEKPGISKEVTPISRPNVPNNLTVPENIANTPNETKNNKISENNQNSSTSFTKFEKQSKKSTLSLWIAFIKLGALVSVFFLLGVVLKKLKSTSLDSSSSGWMKNLQKAIGSGLSKDPKMIQVMANHYLDPKKRITVVRIGSRMLVLGVTHESINLISEMSPEENDDFVGNLFNDFLKKEQVRQPLSAPQASLDAPQGTTVRSQIRNRLEGLKPL